MSEKSTFEDLPQSFIYALGLSGAMALFVVWDQWHWWNTRDDYSFGFLVPFFVAYVVYDRWEQICNLLKGKGRSPQESEGEAETSGNPPETRSSAARPAANWIWPPAAYLLLAFGLMTFFLGAFYRAGSGASNPGSLLIAVGFGCILLPMVFLNVPKGIPNPDAAREPSAWKRVFLDTRFVVASLFLFPAFIWVISAPLVSVVENQISLFLLAKVTKVVFFVFDMGGFPLEQQGNTLILPAGRVGVEDACSGIRSLTACLFAGSFLGAVFLNSLWKKVLLVGIAMLFAFFTNILRSLFLTGWAYANGPEAIEGTVHDVTGYAVLGLTCVGLIALLPVFNFRVEWLHGHFPEDEDSDGGDGNDEGEGSVRHQNADRSDR